MNIKKIAVYIISIFLIFLLFFGAGFFTAVKTMKPETIEITKEVEVVKTVDKIVYRNYNELTFEEIKAILNHYDTEPMAIDFVVNEMNKKYTDIDVNWSLYERSGSTNAKIPVYQSGNFKFYAGVGLGAVATAGAFYGGYKLFEVLR